MSSTATSPSYSAGQAWSRSNASNYTLYAVWKTVPASTTTNMSLSKQSCTNSGGNERAWSCDISGNRKHNADMVVEKELLMGHPLI